MDGRVGIQTQAVCLQISTLPNHSNSSKCRARKPHEEERAQRKDARLTANFTFRGWNIFRGNKKKKEKITKNWNKWSWKWSQQRGLDMEVDSRDRLGIYLYAVYKPLISFLIYNVENSFQDPNMLALISPLITVLSNGFQSLLWAGKCFFCSPIIFAVKWKTCVFKCVLILWTHPCFISQWFRVLLN